MVKYRHKKPTEIIVVVGESGGFCALNHVVDLASRSKKMVMSPKIMDDGVTRSDEKKTAVGRTEDLDNVA